MDQGFSAPASFAAIIDCWPRITDCAADLAQPYETVRQWRLRDSIPSWAFAGVVRAANERGYPVTLALLAGLAEAKREGAA